MKTINGTKTKFSFGKWCNENKLYLLSFILPVISMIIVYFFKDVFPFGDQMYLRSDCYHQYAPYLQILQDKLRSGGSLLYTWEIGGGMNFVALSAYYLASPLNLLTLIWPGNIADIVSFFIVTKMGLASFATTYYLTKKFGKKNIATVAFGMVYALSAYFAAFSWNIMWLDCMWLLPFIILGLDKLVNERKCKMYCIALALSIFSNYYIGIMLCIYSVIYFIYLFCTADVDTTLGKAKARLLILKDYVIYSILGGGLAACVILPEYFNLLTTKSADSSFPQQLEEYFSVLYMIFRSLMNIPVADLKYPHDPNIYCSVAVFVLIPLFWLCKKIPLKERVGKTVIAAIMLLSFSFNIPNYIWHGLHFPNSLPCRESFLYIFLIVTMAYQAIMHIKNFKDSQIIGAAGASIGLILILEEIFKNAEFFSDMVIDTNMIKIIYCSIFFIVLYTAIILLHRKKPDMRGFVAYIMVLTVFCELTLNMAVTGIPSTSSRSGYYESTAAYEQLNEAADADAQNEDVIFFRSENASHSTRNDGARFRYNSISTFSSVSSAAIQDYFDAIGLQTSYNAYSYYGHTPLTAALFSIKYEFSTGEASIPSQTSLLSNASYTTSSGGTSTINLYEYNNTLPLGFMIKSSTMANWDTETGNPFMTQNNFVTSAVSGGATIFHKLKSSAVGTFTTEYDLDENDTYIPTGTEQTFDVYFYCPTSAETLTATVTGATTLTKTFSSTQQNYICYVGQVSAGSTITVTSGDGQALSACYAYAFDSAAWEKDYQLLNAQPYQVESCSDTKITGTVTTDTTGIMYTSIPYDEGWKVYVDGEEASITPICKDSLTGVLVSAGTHEITFKYCPKGFVPGIIITIVCLLAFIGLSYQDKIKEIINKKKTTIKK